MSICYHYMTDQFVEQNLTRQRIKFSKIADFNDRFECCPETALAYIERNPTIANAGIVRFDLEMVAKQIDPLIAVLCLAQKGDNYLLWSHYANKHTGVAIGIDVSHPCFAPAFLNDLVDYDVNRLEIDWGDFSSSPTKMLEHLRLILRRKDKPWDYEKEHRIAMWASNLQKDQGMLFLPLPKDAVKEIVFGEEIDATKRRSITGILDAEYSHVKRLEASRSARGYRLDLSPLT